jgi:hypothetical protein
MSQAQKVQTKTNKEIGDIQSELNRINSEIGKKSNSEINKELDKINARIDKLNSDTKEEMGKIESATNREIKKIQSGVKEETMKVRDDTLEKVKSEIKKTQPTGGTTLEIRETAEQLSYLINLLFGEEPADLEKEPEAGESEAALRVSQGEILGALTENAGEKENKEIQARISELNSKAAGIQSSISQKSKEMESKARSLQTKIENKLGVFGDILKSMKPCQPSPIGVLGDPCQNRKEIEEKQAEIEEKTEQLSFLRALLTKEMETGLERELQTLNPETAEGLKNNLKTVLDDSAEIISLAENNSELPDDCTAEKCSSVCPLSFVFSIKACLMIGTGEQKPIEMKFTAGVSMEDLNLGKVGIKNINLNLPEKIQLAKLQDLVITIPAQEISITFPKETLPVNFRPQVPLPKLQEISFSCSRSSTANPYQCSQGEKGKELAPVEYEWYLATFSYLSENCQKFPGMRSNIGIGYTTSTVEKIKDCFDPENLAQILISQCALLWEDYTKSVNLGNPINAPPQICTEVVGTPEAVATAQCQKLFILEKEAIPSACTPSLISPCDRPPEECPSPQPNPEYKPIETFKNKCAEIRNKGRREIPQPCQFLPLITGKLGAPAPLQYPSQQEECSSQKITGSPTNLPGCDFSLPSLPKITFPKIIIPDINLPHFTLYPFLEVKLPNIVFEDLVLPDIDLCNLDDCRNFFPSVVFRFPFLSLPSLSSSLPLPDYNIDLRIKIDFPAIPFTIPSLPLSSLIAPEIELPKIPLPAPKFLFSFSGIDMSAIVDYIITFILNALGVPEYSLCISFKFDLIPIRFIYPDYYFSWPAFPKIPPISYCKDINKFCKDVKIAIKEVTDKINRIQDEFNKVVQKQVQEKLDKLAQLVSSETTKQIDQTFEGYRQEIAAAVKKGTNLITLKERKITIPLAKYAKDAGVPPEVKIPWPAALKKISLTKGVTYDLPTIKLSKLSYKKEFSLKIAGFQKRTVSINLSQPGNLGECLGSQPTGGNPCPTDKVEFNLSHIQNIKHLITDSSQKIIDILK